MQVFYDVQETEMVMGQKITKSDFDLTLKSTEISFYTNNYFMLGCFYSHI